MDLNYAIIALIVGIVATVIGLTIQFKNKKTRQYIGWGGVVIIVVLFIVPNYFAPVAMSFMLTPIAGTTYTPPYAVSPGQGVQTPGGGITLNTVNPTISIAGSDAQASGTVVAGTTSQSYAINGGTFGALSLGTTTAVAGQTIEMVLANSSYHTKYVPSMPIASTSFPVAVQFDKNATVTEYVYSTTGVVLTNNLSAAPISNQTALGNGASYNLKDEMTASALQSTNDMTCIIEIEAGNNATVTPLGATLSLNGNALPIVGTSKPVWYTTMGTNSNVYLYDVPALKTSATQTFTIGLNAKSTGQFQTLSHVVKSCYTKEWFIDPNTGKAVYAVADSNGALKSIASYKYMIIFQ
jgi:hypothetical protein